MKSFAEHGSGSGQPGGKDSFDSRGVDGSSGGGHVARKLRILLADDDSICAAITERHIRKLGHEVTSVSDGRQAVEAAVSIRPDLMLMDLQMPHMDGLEAARRIRERETAGALGRIAIVALTADTMGGEAGRCRAAGMDDYLTKPVRADALVVLIEKLFGPGRS